MKTASSAMTYEKVKMGKTGFRRQLDKEVRAKVLLSEASLWQVVKHLVIKYEYQLFVVAAFGVGIVIGFSI